MPKRKGSVVSNHMTQRTAEKALVHWWGVQAKALKGSAKASAMLGRAGIGPESNLVVRMERKRFYKWAVVAV